MKKMYVFRFDEFVKSASKLSPIGIYINYYGRSAATDLELRASGVSMVDDSTNLVLIYWKRSYSYYSEQEVRKAHEELAEKIKELREKLEKSGFKAVLEGYYE